ncbi:hypothetical protein CDD80_801 [Ophiocordyceps camponoti-rufipedis]|uniref:Uncharacterized protein n=1 Tax=Ophiocordyceps camponoti-rufipedis TaxID=2004952 RepID=A0A2C5ZBY5_9HYPO|nr:hypothetical protein CDD80_801 [Ophiocordyceps camponoti-rufipedis]
MVQRNHVVAIIIIVIFVILALVAFGIAKMVTTARKDLTEHSLSTPASAETRPERPAPDLPSRLRTSLRDREGQLPPRRWTIQVRESPDRDGECAGENLPTG